MKQCLIITGATASGKSSLALDIANLLQGTIINSDSMQVYANLRILTDRPQASALRSVPHMLYGYLDASQRGSVHRWLRDAQKAIDFCHEAGSLPIVVGGTGLYLKALMEGISAIPEIPQEIRDNLKLRAIHEGPESLYSQLQSLVPEEAQNIWPGDCTRIIRSLEVFLATGKPMSFWHSSPSYLKQPNVDFKSILIQTERHVLYDRCNKRFLSMLKNGAINEVRKLFSSHNYLQDKSLPIFKAHGLPEIHSFLQGKSSLEEIIQRSSRNTRNYVKRQLTWFKHNLSPDLIISSPTEIVSKIQYLMIRKHIQKTIYLPPPDDSVYVDH